MYKSKQEKLQLLDDAIALHDGNAIIAVSLIREVGMGGDGRCVVVGSIGREENRPPQGQFWVEQYLILPTAQILVCDTGDAIWAVSW